MRLCIFAACLLASAAQANPYIRAESITSTTWFFEEVNYQGLPGATFVWDVFPIPTNNSGMTFTNQQNSETRGWCDNPSGSTVVRVTVVYQGEVEQDIMSIPCTAIWPPRI